MSKNRLFGLLFLGAFLALRSSVASADTVAVFEPYSWGDEPELHFAHCLEPGQALRFSPDILDFYDRRQFVFVDEFKLRLQGPRYTDTWAPRWEGDTENFTRVGFRTLEVRYPTLRNLPWVHLVVEPEDGIASRAVIFLLHSRMNEECR